VLVYSVVVGAGALGRGPGEKAVSGIPHSKFMPSRHLPAPRRMAGLVARRERWGLTVRGWAVVVGLAVLAAVGVGRTIHPFLAIIAPVEGPVVVVEAWVPPAILKATALRYQNDASSVFYCVGGPTDEKFDSTRVEDTSAFEAAEVLRSYGIPDSRIQPVPTAAPVRDRTYTTAVALRDWFRDRGQSVHALTVVTEGPHARRSRILFQKAFDSDVEIGVVGIPDPTYDAAHWWRSSEGIKVVISESAAYLFTRFLFWPESDALQEV
jgi:hypothetical protein